MEEFKEKIKELGIVFYQRTYEQDIQLLNWWHELQQSGDFGRLFADSQLPLSKFLKLFDPPCILSYTTDEENKIKHAIWFTPLSDSPTAAFVGFWTRESARGTRHMLKASVTLYSLAFKMFQTLVGVTKHEHLLRIHRKMGYNISGQVPNFLEGNDAWIVYLTEENFKASRVYQVGGK